MWALCANQLTMATKEETEEALSILKAELVDPNLYTFHIPHWDPVEAKEGLWWFKSQLWEGYYVSYRKEEQQKIVYFKYWEYGDEEPSWESIKYGA